jgi:hypothetical protein
VVVANAPGGVAARTDVTLRPLSLTPLLSVNSRDTFKPVNGQKFDWRGWIALAWVLWWGRAYFSMAIEAKGPQLMVWIHGIWK